MALSIEAPQIFPQASRNVDASVIFVIFRRIDLIQCGPVAGALDTGTGIPGEQLPKIFEAFTRLDATRCDGLGIGLFIVRQALGILGTASTSPLILAAGFAFPFRCARDEEGANAGEHRARREKEAQFRGRYHEQSRHNHFRSTGLAAHLRKEVPIPHRNESYRQTASAAASRNG
jgi:hypothetical protein